MSENDQGVASDLAIISELRAIRELCIQIEALVGALATPTLCTSLQHIFPTPAHLEAFRLSDGIRSTRQIGEVVGKDQKTVSNWWRDWEKLGIVEKSGSRGQFRKSVSLADLILRYGRFRSQEERPQLR